MATPREVVFAGRQSGCHPLTAMCIPVSPHLLRAAHHRLQRTQAFLAWDPVGTFRAAIRTLTGAVAICKPTHQCLEPCRDTARQPVALGMNSKP